MCCTYVWTYVINFVTQPKFKSLIRNDECSQDLLQTKICVTELSPYYNVSHLIASQMVYIETVNIIVEEFLYIQNYPLGQPFFKQGAFENDFDFKHNQMH